MAPERRTACGAETPLQLLTAIAVVGITRHLWSLKDDIGFADDNIDRKSRAGRLLAMIAMTNHCRQWIRFDRISDFAAVAASY